MNNASDKDTPRNADRATPPSSAGRRDVAVINGQLDSRDLFVGTREISIAHGSETYRLRLTAQNKLILTK